MELKMKAVPLGNIELHDKFWSKLVNLVIDVMLPYQADILEDKIDGAEKSHAIRNFRIAAGEEIGDFYGMVFQDSDVAKWIESVAYALTVKPNQELEDKADEYIALIEKAQEADGYLNTFFTLKKPDKKWTNLQEAHELYCSGHMIEAAVAYFGATGKDKLLNVMKKNADLICSRFGEGRERGIPGHQEIELALLRLYQITGEKRYLETAKYFLEERGKEPNFFETENERRGWQHFRMNPKDRHYAQNHQHPLEQDQAVGHSVRAIYMYASMALLAQETKDVRWHEACRRLWENITEKQMYITGGIGQTVRGEAFTIDYDLPNDTVYAETCASVAMVFFSRYMNELEPKGKYGDVIEKMFYNGALSGMQLDGKRFFYVNPLEVVPGISGKLFGHTHVKTTRPEWYTCACCPPNLARLLASIGQYAWSENSDTLYSHLYVSGKLDSETGGGVCIVSETDFPWKDEITYTFHPKNKEATLRFAFRLPGWSRETTFTVNGKEAEHTVKNGYCYVSRLWSEGDILSVKFDMKPKRVYANTKVRDNAGCVALMRGPLVYAFEEVDNGENLSALRVPRDAEIRVHEINLESVGDVVVLELEGFRMASGESLYDTKPPSASHVKLVAVPYYAWGNRKPGGMRVWMVE